MVNFGGNGFSFITEENLVYLFRLFDIDYIEFYNEIQNMIIEFHSLTNSSKISLPNFPFIEMVNQALLSDRNHWIRAAIPWMKVIGVNFFADRIKNLAKNKKVDQKLRHELLRLCNSNETN